MKDLNWIVLFVAWSAGVIVGSQACRVEPVRAEIGSRAPATGSPVGRLACALVEVGDAVVALPKNSQNTP